MSYMSLSITDHILNLSNLILPYRCFDNQQIGHGAQLEGNIDNLELADTKLFLSDGSYSSDGNTLGTGVAEYFGVEIAIIQEFKALFEQGHSLLTRLYVYRQVGKAVPSAVDDALKQEVYKETVNVLAPFINFTSELVEFRTKVCNTVNFQLHSLNEYYFGNKQLSMDFDFFPSPDLLGEIANVLGLLVDLDFVKSLKPSLNNDLSCYKRALHLSSQHAATAQEDMALLQTLYFFLCSSDPFVTELKKSLGANFTALEKILVDLLDYCIDKIEDTALLIIEEKHTLLKTICLVFVLMDTPVETHDKEARKRLEKRFDKVLRLVKQSPIIFGFGEAPLALHFILSKSKLFGLESMKRADFEDTKVKYVDFAQVVKQLAAEDHTCSLALLKAKSDLNLSRPTDPDFDKQFFDTVQSNLASLNKSALTLKEFFVHRISKPASSKTAALTEAQPTLYELAIQYNFARQELLQMVKLCQIIVQCSNRLLILSLYAREAIARHVQRITIDYATTALADATISASKARKPIAVILQRLKDFALDYGDGSDNQKHNHLNLTQFSLLRIILHFVSSKKAKGMVGGLLKSKNFKDSELTATNNFVKLASVCPKLLALDNTVRTMADLSVLYARELYVEMCQVSQFPLHASLPFLMLQTIYEESSLSVQCAALVPFAIYNDAATCALFKLKTQHIYKEIEAEAGLLIDLFVFEVSERIYGSAKLKASESWLDPAILEEVNRLQVSKAGTSTSKNGPERRNSLLYAVQSSNLASAKRNSSWLEFAVNQKSFQLLGRSINLSNLIGDSLNKLFQNNLSLIFLKCESSSISHIIEIETLLKVTETAHESLSKSLCLANWQHLLLFQDEQIGLTCFNGRLLSRVLVELLEDVIPNWCYNESEKRFVKSPVQLHEPPKCSKPPKMTPITSFGSKELAFAFSIKHNSSSLEQGHFNSIARILGEHGISVVFGELCKHLEYIMHQCFDELVPFFAANCPKSLLLPTLPSGFVGVYEFLKQQLKPLMECPQFGSFYLQGFREMGNTLLVLGELQQALELQKLRLRIQMFPLLASVDQHSQKSMLEHATRLGDNILFPDPLHLSSSRWAHNISRVYASHVPNLLRAALGKIRYFLLQRLVNVYSYEPNHIMSLCPTDTITDPKAFFRVWSATVFSCCVLNTFPGYTSKEIYGDGLLYAGCVLTFLLDQSAYLKSLDYTQHVLSFANDLLRGSTLGSNEMHAVLDLNGTNDSTRTLEKKRVVSMATPEAGGTLSRRPLISSIGQNTLHAISAHNAAKLLKAEDSKRIELERFSESAFMMTFKMNSFLSALEEQFPPSEENFMDLIGVYTEEPNTFSIERFRTRNYETKQTFTLVSSFGVSKNENRSRAATKTENDAANVPDNRSAPEMASNQNAFQKLIHAKLDKMTAEETVNESEFQTCQSSADFLSPKGPPPPPPPPPTST